MSGFKISYQPIKKSLGALKRLQAFLPILFGLLIVSSNTFAKALYVSSEVLARESDCVVKGQVVGVSDVADIVRSSFAGQSTLVEIKVSAITKSASKKCSKPGDTIPVVAPVTDSTVICPRCVVPSSSDHHTKLFYLKLQKGYLTPTSCTQWMEEGG